MSVSHTESDRFKLVEDMQGAGVIELDGAKVAVRYSVRRFQGMTLAGLPVPGVHRIDGEIALETGALPRRLVGRSIDVLLADGRTLRVTLIDAEGRILAEGHGPSRCSCC